MCMALAYKTKNMYFGRNLDLEFSYHETVTITPRNYVFKMRKVNDVESHYAIIGMAYVVDNYPLYYDGSNEKGLSMAGLNFADNADYKDEVAGKDNVSPFEFIPWILSQCATVSEARKLLDRINLVNVNFSEQLPLSPLHWIIADRDESIVVESVKEGLKVYDNPYGMLTNNPTFDFHLLNINNYLAMTNTQPTHTFGDVKPNLYSRGMGSLGLPGGLDSVSRLVRGIWTKFNSVCDGTDEASIVQFFHILGASSQTNGCAEVAPGKYEKTIYSSCCNVDTGVFYYTTYEDSQINGIDMHKENLDGTELVLYPIVHKPNINMVN